MAQRIKRKQMADTFYVDALEKLSPLRYHIHELIITMEQYNLFAQQMNYPKLSEAKITAAKQASEIAEAFFTGRKQNKL